MENKSVEQLISELVETGVFDSIGDGISIQDTDYKILYQNSKHKSFVGEHIGEYCYKAYEKRRHICEGCPLTMTFKDGLPHTEERTAPTDKGISHFEITASPLRDKTGKIIAGIEVARDITERKTAEKLIERSENKYRTLLNNIPQKIFYKDIESVYILCNESYAKDLNIEPSEIIGKTDYEFYPKELAEKYRTDDKKIMDSGKISEIEEKYIADGKEMTVNTLKAPILDESGKTIGIFGIFWDITDRKQAENIIQRLEKMEAIGTLAGGIAHDFNNLLTVILNNMYLVKMFTKSDRKILEHIESAEKASMKAKSLTQQLLTFARGGAPIKELVNIKDVINESASFSLRGSNVQCESCKVDSLCHVEVDAGQMSQVFNNIIINANQSMPGGGTISVDCENVTVEAENPLPLEKGDYIKISIKDRGTGISEEHMTKIFDPYFTTKEKGSGLGLATAYSIVKRHYGHIEVESTLGLGTTFHIYLPASKEKALDKKPSEAKPISGKGNILIMDDDELVRDSLGQILESLGYHSEFAIDGREAVEAYRNAMASGQPFDVVIMDLTIPGGAGGKDTIEKLKKVDPNIKAIVSSGYSHDPVMANYCDYGFKD
jgi:PAS domain S-box-containing protein